ncbi:hypothetical protein COV12_00555 [Candidatus Woesearchaeota archaeon CG10_big_fil_rev_8_21_14_0_10_32_24]|nr:MAG: hypothetical protein COV12_00555 [Candidatus Woesearchaeota archaeon CG10_big_fil_rev_8_21_14_0_10_32_24]
MRTSHDDQIVRWAKYVRENPTKWKKPHTEFINAIFDKHEQFKKRLLKTKGGKDKLEKLYPQN